MNKLLLTTVSVIAMGLASQAMAASSSGSNQAYIGQTGTSQTATIDQSGGTDDQVGTLANPFLQGNGTGSGGNIITITQTGSGNTFGTDEAAFQSGTNLASVTQQGTNSNVDLQQTGYGNGNAGIPPYVSGGAAWAGGLPGVTPGYGSILQDSTADASNISVTEAGSDGFDLRQGGASNGITLQQNAGEGFDLAFAWQQDDVSSSSISITQQEPTAHDSLYAVAVQQGGTNNSVTIGQTGDFLDASILQNGSFNVFQSTQSGNNAGFGATDGGFTADNFANIVKQIGNSNQIYNTQVGGPLRNSGVSILPLVVLGIQDGTSNVLTNNQSGGNNTLNFTQLGGPNNISNTQSGTGNNVTATQTGTGSTSTFGQSGDHGIVLAYQNGNAMLGVTGTGLGAQNSISVTDSGSHDVVLLTQGVGTSIIGCASYSSCTGPTLSTNGAGAVSGDSITVTQSAGGPGLGNIVAVAQTTSGNIANVSQSGTSNIVMIRQ